MNTRIQRAIVCMGILFFAGCFAGVMADEIETEMEMEKKLSTLQRKIVAIGAFTAKGDLESMNRVLDEGLDAGLTVNEAGEILLQMYAYAGFPRSLNGLNALSEVLEKRKADGKDDALGSEPDRLSEDTDKYSLGADNLAVLMGIPLNQIKPENNGYGDAMDVFLKEHLFADIFGRNNISFQRRELATVGALCGLEGTNSQLMFHMNAAMNCDLSKDQMDQLVGVIGEELGEERGRNAGDVLSQLMERRKSMSENDREKNS